jgi:Phospholipid methyltransferase
VATQDRANVAVQPPLIPLAMVGRGFVAHFGLSPAAGARKHRTTARRCCGPCVDRGCRHGCARVVQGQDGFRCLKINTVLVRSGVFRWSENPACSSMLSLCLGTALVVNPLLMLLLSIPVGRLLCPGSSDRHPTRGELSGSKMRGAVPDLQSDRPQVGLTSCWPRTSRHLRPMPYNAAKNSPISRASTSGCSSAAKCPPFGITVQRRMSV